MMTIPFYIVVCAFIAVCIVLIYVLFKLQDHENWIKGRQATLKRVNETLKRGLNPN